MDGPAGGVTPRLFDFRAGDDAEPLRAALERFAPHAVVLFRPNTLPAGAFADLQAPVLGVVDEPLPGHDRPAEETDLAYNLAELARTDRANVDRVVLTQPLDWDAAAPLLPLWRTMPLPVADGLYRRPTVARHPPRMVFIGHASAHREDALVGLKHKFDLPHYAHALMGEELREVLAASDVGIHLRNARWVITLGPSVLLHLAAGHLLLSEPIWPRFGLEPGIHYVEFDDKYELDLRVHQLVRDPNAYERVRIRGHHFSRQFRASAVWPRLVRDLLTDVAVFGTERRTAVPA
jgi:hypothetical protein